MIHDDFVINKYYNIYMRIIQQAGVRKEIIQGENHHIIPRSMGGTNTQSNIILLTYREHFLCHVLLTKFTKGDSLRSMIKARWGMSNQKRDLRDIKMNSTLYEQSRKLFCESQSMYMKQNNPMKNPKTRAKLSASKLGKKSNCVFTDEIRKKFSDVKKGKNNPMNKGKWLTPWGEFTTSTEAANMSPLRIPQCTIYKWCINSSSIITIGSIRQSKLLLKEHEGCTFKDIGYDFILY